MQIVWHQLFLQSFEDVEGKCSDYLCAPYNQWRTVLFAGRICHNFDVTGTEFERVQSFFFSKLPLSDTRIPHLFSIKPCPISCSLPLFLQPSILASFLLNRALDLLLKPTGFLSNSSVLQSLPVSRHCGYCSFSHFLLPDSDL